ncbi:MAG: copper chaperone PCu(A)C [Gammaproteobacteria bacterium]|nr:copper chaperone PCu(A)C [Gammaproteobacteria bacterium]
MKNFMHILFILVAFTLSSSTIAATSASESVTVINPYVRAVPPGQTVSAAFMQLENTSGTMHSIVNATSPVSKAVELHTHINVQGVMKMRRVEKMDIPANGKTVLKPGGLHIMLIDLHEKLKLDQKVSVTLEFEDGSRQKIEAPVRKIMMKGMMKNIKH